MSRDKSMCGKNPPSNLKEASRFHAACVSYVKCDHKKCNDSELKLKSEIVKIPIEKTLKIIQKCIKEKGEQRRKCGINEQKKLSPKIKKLVEDIESCRYEKCKTESEDMFKASDNLLNSKKMQKPIKKFMKDLAKIRKSKTLKKIVQKEFSKMIKKQAITNHSKKTRKH
jgi:hypothetical protein